MAKFRQRAADIRQRTKVEENKTLAAELDALAARYIGAFARVRELIPARTAIVDKTVNGLAADASENFLLARVVALGYLENNDPKGLARVAHS